MNKKLYVHVGTPKTGTSAIQQFCAKNENAFEKRKYCYPIMPYRYPHKAIVRNGHFLTGPIYGDDGQRCMEEEKRIFIEGMEKIKKLFSTYEAIILSDETLWRSTSLWRPELWEQLKEIGKEIGFDVVIIVYLRRQDEYLTSLWSQDVKEGHLKASVRTWEEWFEIGAEDKILDYKKKINEYIEAVGIENVVVRRYDRAEFIGGSIYSDFLRAVDLELTDDFIIMQEERNLGLKGNTNEIRRVINTLPGIARNDHLFFRKVLLGFSEISAQNYKSTIMSKEEKEAFLATYEMGNREVAKCIFGEEGELFEMAEEELPKWEKDNPYMIDDVIRLVAVITMELREENRRLYELVRHPIRHYRKAIVEKIKKKIMR